MAHDVFLSYSNKDKVAAETVSRALEASGVRVWMAPRDFFPGLDRAESIRAAMDQARFFVLVFSSRANASEHTLRELDYAVSHGKPVIPFRIEDVKPSGRMASLLAVSQWVDAFSPPLEPHADRLAALLRRMLWPSAPVSASGPSASGGGSSDSGSASTGFSVAAARERSRASAREESQWVRKEIEHARDAARVTGRPAEILPIILEGPPPPPPPDALADLHFNDPLCYVIAAEEKLNALRPPRAE